MEDAWDPTHCHTHGYELFQLKNTKQTSKEKRHMGGSVEEASPREVTQDGTHFISPGASVVTTCCDNTGEGLPPREAKCSGFLLGLVP